MKNRRFAALLSAALAASLLIGCGGSSGTAATTAAPAPAAPAATTAAPAAAPAETKEETKAAPVEKRIVRWADTGSTAEFDEELTPGAIAVKRMGDKLNELSGGKFELKIFADGQLAGSNDEIINGLKTGAFEGSCQSTGNWAEYSKAFYFMNIPFLFQSADEAWALMDSDIGREAFKKVYDDTGIYILDMYDIGFRQLTANKEIHTAADMKGLKIRTQVDDIQVAAFEALGCSVTPISFGELFSALQQGLVEAQENPFSNIVAIRLYEVQKYLTLTNHSYTMTAFAFSPQFVDSLTEEERGWLEEAVKYGVDCGREAIIAMNNDYIDQLKGYGMEIYEPSPEELKTFSDAVAPAWDKVKELMGEEEFNRVISFIEDYRAKK